MVHHINHLNIFKALIMINDFFVVLIFHFYSYCVKINSDYLINFITKNLI